jgi:hypothetical protein
MKDYLSGFRMVVVSLFIMAVAILIFVPLMAFPSPISRGLKVLKEKK